MATTKKVKQATDNDLKKAVSNLSPSSKQKTTPIKSKATAAKEPKKKLQKNKGEVDSIKEAVAIAATQKTVLNKPLKYVYPKGCIDTQARKSHRQKIRKQNTAFLAKIASAKVKDKKELKAKYEEFCKVNFAEKAV